MKELIFSIHPALTNQKQLLAIQLLTALREGPFLIPLDLISLSSAKKIATSKEQELLLALSEADHLARKKGISASDALLIPPGKVEPLLKQLAATGRLFCQGKQIACDFFTKVTLIYQIEKGEKGFLLSGKLTYGEKIFSLKECLCIAPGEDRHCFIEGISLKWIATEVRWRDLKRALDSPILSSEELEELKEEANDPKTPQLEWIGNTEELHAQEQEPLPILELKDGSGSFANLWMNYGEEERTLYHPLSMQKREKRRKAVEEQWERDLLETDFIRKSFINSHYYCPLDKVGKSLAFLLEIGWTILDSKGARLISHTATSLTYEEEKESIHLKGSLHFGSFKADLKQLQGAFNRRSQFLQLDSDTVGLLPDSWNEYSHLQTILDEGILENDQLSLPKYKAGCLLPLMEQRFLEPKDSSFLASIQQFEKIQSVTLSPLFQGQLRDYQQKGVDWLRFLYDYNLHGLLADEMGLGKTVQILAFLTTLKSNRAPLLIIMPTTLLFNWKKEIERFIPSWQSYMHHGADRYKEMDQLMEQSIILTTYTTLRLDALLFSKISFEAIVLDEAQLIKNSATQISQLLCSLKANFRLSLTGTPIENHAGELWSHFRFLMPHLLGEEKSFMQNLNASQLDPRYLQLTKRLIKPFILRRCKEEVAKDLPEKIEQTVWIELSEAERETYEKFLKKSRSTLLTAIENGGMGKKRMEIFEAILRLRQLCCHPLLIDSYLEESGCRESTKLEALLEDLENTRREGRKALVYSQFTTMLGLIKKRLQEKSLPFLYLDGKTSDREKLVEKFQNDPEIPFFLISLKAGGVGLNLTAADTVFLYDPWWNQAVENQAIDRAHRIGRNGPVIAKRYLAVETIEEKMMKLKEKKREIAQDILEELPDNLSLSQEELLFLLE